MNDESVAIKGNVKQIEVWENILFYQLNIYLVLKLLERKCLCTKWVFFKWIANVPSCNVREAGMWDITCLFNICFNRRPHTDIVTVSLHCIKVFFCFLPPSQALNSQFGNVCKEFLKELTQHPTVRCLTKILISFEIYQCKWICISQCNISEYVWLCEVVLMLFIMQEFHIFNVLVSVITLELQS